MKTILVVDKELPELVSDRVLVKRNKTIIKDKKYFNYDFICTLDVSFKFYLEEWEICNKEKVQLVIANNGDKLRPVHIITDAFPKNGAKALFQSEKMLILRMSNGIFELSKNTIDDTGTVESNTIKTGRYEDLVSIDLPEIFLPILKHINDVKNDCIAGKYKQPIWAI